MDDIYPISDDDIVISGISGRYPNSENIMEFWDNLINSENMCTPETKRWLSLSNQLPKKAGTLKSLDDFDLDFFDISEKLANYMDPQQRIAHEVTYEALYDAGVDPKKIGTSKTGCFCGSCYNDTEFARLLDHNKLGNYLEKNVQYICSSFNFEGTSFTIDTACAASFSALHQAVLAMKSNEIDQALILGLAVHLRPQVTAGFSNLRMLSPEGKSKSLDAGVDGYCRSEAVVSVFLQKRKKAKRIYSIIYHSQTNCDGYKTEGITFPSSDAQYRLMKETYKECKLDPVKYINYVEGHMTGTPVGDPVESHAILKALRPNNEKPLMMGCLKSNMGHTEGASALCGITKCALIFQQEIIPPNINYEKPNPNIEGLKNGLIIPVLNKTPFTENFIALNAFGFGGVNVHAILKANERNAVLHDYEIFKSEYKLLDNWYEDDKLHIQENYKIMSSKSKGNLLRLINVSGRINDGVKYIFDFIVKNRQKINVDFLQLLEDLSYIEPETKLNIHGYMTWSPELNILTQKTKEINISKPLYLVFSGLGCQWPKMGRSLLILKPFADTIVRLNTFTKKQFNFDLLKYLTTEMTSEEFNSDVSKVTTSISAIQIALVDLIQFLEIKISGYIGHSVGEYACAYLDGAASGEQILHMVYELTSLAKNNLAPNYMVSVGLSYNEVVKRFPNIYTCCDNSPENTTIGGSEKDLEIILEQLKKEDIFIHKIESCKQVFHAECTKKIYDQVLNKFKKIVNIKFKPSSKWISTSIKEGTNEKEQPDTLAKYLADNLVNPVWFTQALLKLPKNCCIYEVGPHSQLLPLVKQTLENKIICISSLKRNDNNNNLNNFFSSIGELYLNSIPSKISKLFQKVTYPVSKQTLSLSHLLKWNHSQKYFVYRFPEYFNTFNQARKIEITSDNPKYSSWYGHCIDGRVLLPATGYLLLAWEVFVTMVNDINTIPVEFYNVQLKRAIILPKNRQTNVIVKVIDSTGEFCISESDQICCTGQIKKILDCESKINPLQYKNRNPELNGELLQAENVYKELRVRGYDYTGSFQGIQEAYASGRQGKVKWNDNWAAFADALLQVSILGEKNRNLYVPTTIEYMRCEVITLRNYVNELKKTGTQIPIFDVYYDPILNIGSTIGLLVKGVKVTEAARRIQNQKAFLQEYKFVPYKNNFILNKEILTKLNNYEEILIKLIKGLNQKIECLEEVDLNKKELTEKYSDKNIYSIANLLFDILRNNYLIEKKLDENNNEELEKIDETKELNNEKQETNDIIKVESDKNNKVIEEHQEIDLNDKIFELQESLNKDYLFCHSFKTLFNNQVTTILENFCTKFIKVLEINFTSYLLNEHFNLAISANQVRTEYNLLHPMPALKSITSSFGINKVFELKEDKTIPKDLNEIELIIYKHWSTGYINTWKKLDINYFKPNLEEEKKLLKNTYNCILDGGFMVYCYRNKLTLVEEKIMELGGHSTDIELFNKEELIKYLEKIGFNYIGEEIVSDYTCNSILLRKVVKNVKQNASDFVAIEAKVFEYDWVERVKHELIKDSKKNIWLISQNCSFNGLIGMIKCLKKEPEGERIRCLFNLDECDNNKFIEKNLNRKYISFKDEQSKKENENIKKIEINEDLKNVETFEDELLKKKITLDLIQKDLSMNIYKNHELGSYRQTEFYKDLKETSNYAVVDMVTKGDMSSFRWFKSFMQESKKFPKLLYLNLDENTEYKPDMFDVYYSALNFKDIMVASGRVPTSAYPNIKYMACNLIGMEFSGKLSNGKRVMGITSGSGIATKFFLYNQKQMFDVPDEWTLAQAATVPVVYLTVYYALFIRGNLLPGEKVLIHAGSGGVGFAAISICLARGCEVFTTVSNEKKKKFLMTKFPALKEQNFANSRDVNFEEHILLQTNGYGVDVVLNSLAEEKLRASVRCLAPFGRFLEIGKYDIIQNNALDISYLGNNKTFNVVCLAHLLTDTQTNKSNNHSKEMFDKCREFLENGIKNKEVIPLETCIFKKDECEQAFRFMANGKHMGKVLIEIRKEEENKAEPLTVVPKTFCDPLKSYIITGGLGGFGMELAIWLISIGARKLILTSRSGIKSTYQEMQVRKMRELGAEIKIINENCYDLESTSKLLTQARDLGPIGGIFNLAVVLRDAIFTNQSKETFEEACLAKINTTFFLDQLTRNEIDYKYLDYFICFSSIASGIGNPGQTNYGFANSSMERLVELRSIELKDKTKCVNSAIQWGAIGDVGLFAEKFNNDVTIAGMIPQRIISCMQTLDNLLNYNISIISSIVLADESKVSNLGSNHSNLVKTIMHVLGVDDPSTLDENVTLTELGMDSLMAVEIKQGLEREYDVIMTTQEIRNLTYKRLQEMSVELEQKAANKNSEINESESEIYKRLDNILNSPEDLFVILYTSNSSTSMPIFFLPPIEGEFSLMQKLTPHLTRPVVGINWISLFDEMSTIKEVSEYIKNKLIEKYGVKEFDFIGYSFGSILGLEIAILLQNDYNVGTIRKLIMLDGSHEFTKSKCHELANRLSFNKVNEKLIQTTMLVKFVAFFYNLENVEKHIEDLMKIPDMNTRTQNIALLIESKLNYKVDIEKLKKSTKRLYVKTKMIFMSEITNKLRGDIILIRATDSMSSFMLQSVSDSYGIEKLCTGKTQIIRMVGDHTSFISNNIVEIANIIENETTYLSI